jgi:hypothetical protein
MLPDTGSKDRFAGVIGMTFKLDPLIALVAGTQSGNTGYAFMVNHAVRIFIQRPPANTVIAVSPKPPS